MDSYQYIDNEKAWLTALAHCQHSKVLAVDTEFIRRETFYPIAALIQLATEDACFLVDPLAIEDLSGLAELLVNPNIVKILHACSEDLEVFQRLLNVVPSPLFDTQIAAGYVGLRFSMGYQGLVKEMLDIELGKGETQSNWLQRPLSDSQLEYAALDTLHLLTLYDQLSQRLQESGRDHWLKEDCDLLVQSARQNVGQDYTRVKQARRLQPRSLAMLKGLVDWREKLARDSDRPRSWIIADKCLIGMAMALPENEDALLNVDDMPTKFVARHAETIIAITAHVKALPNEELPASIPGPLGVQQTKQLKKMKSLVRGWAEEWQVAPEQLLRAKEFELIQRWQQDNRIELSAGLTGWRYEQVVKPLVSNMA